MPTPDDLSVTVRYGDLFRLEAAARAWLQSAGSNPPMEESINRIAEASINAIIHHLALTTTAEERQAAWDALPVVRRTPREGK